jgi:hypothetical protein
VDRHEQVGLHRARLAHPLGQRHEEVAVAREEAAHVRLGVDALAQPSGHAQHHVLLLGAAAADRARILAAVARVDRDRHEARDRGRWRRPAARRVDGAWASGASVRAGRLARRLAGGVAAGTLARSAACAIAPIGSTGSGAPGGAALGAGPPPAAIACWRFSQLSISSASGSIGTAGRRSSTSRWR